MIFSKGIKESALYYVIHFNGETYSLAELAMSVETFRGKSGFLGPEDLTVENWVGNYDCYCERSLTEGQVVVGRIKENEENGSDYEVLEVIDF